MQFRVKLVWTGAAHRDARARALKRWFRLMEDETTAGHVLTLWLDARAWLKMGAVVLVALWLGLAGGLWLWLQRDPFNRVGFADLACPWRWDGIRDRRGQSCLAAGFDAIRRGRINEGLLDWKQGFARHPDDAAARLAAARFYASAGYYAGVRSIMMPQLARSRPPGEFVRFLVEAAAENDDHATMLAVCDRVLTDEAPAADDRGWLEERKAAALLALEQPQAALQALDRAGRERSLDWRRLRVQALCDADRAAEAVTEIRAWTAADLPEEFRLSFLAEACRRAGRLEEMAAALAALERLHPMAPAVWVQAVTEYTQAGWRDAAEKALADGLRHVDANATKVEEMRAGMVAAGDPRFVALCVTDARELGRPTAVPLLDLAITQLRSGDAPAAEQSFAQCLAAQRLHATNRGVLSDLAARRRARFSPGSRRIPGAADGAEEVPVETQDWMRALLALRAQPEDARVESLLGVLNRGHFSRETYVCTADVLTQAHCWPALAATMRLGLAKFPGSTELTQWSRRAAREIAAMAPAPASPAKPDPAATPSPPSGSEPEPSDLTGVTQDGFLQRLDQAIAQRDWRRADGWIANVRHLRPSWLAGAEGELTWREARCALEEGEINRLVLCVGLRLDDHPTEAPRALELVRELRDRKNRSSALLLARRLVRAVPAFRAGRATLLELEDAERTKAEPAGGAKVSTAVAQPVETVAGDPP